MSYTVQWQDIRTRARELADAENSTGEAWMSDVKLLRHGNAALGKYHTLLVQAHPEPYTTSTDYTSHSTPGQYALPADYYAVRGVEQVDGDYNRELQYLPWQERNRYGNGNGDGLAYLVIGSNLEIRPKPTGGTYRLWYIKHADTLVNDTDTVEGHNGWEEFIVCELALVMKAKDDSDPGAIMTKLADIRAEMLKAARNRKAAGPSRIADVRPEHLRGVGTWRRDWDFWRS